MSIRVLKATLVSLQVLLLVAISILFVVTTAGTSAADADRAAPAAAPLIVSIGCLASIALSGVLAAQTGRSILGWIFLATFVPIIGPIILASLRSRMRLDSASSPVAAAPRGADTAARLDPTDNPGGFCPRCLSETTDETPGNMNTFNGIGTTLMGTRWRTRGLHLCPACGSVVQTKWVAFGFGVKPLGTYRVIYTKRGLTTSRLFARRLRDDPVAR